jgi:hypothetical protein
MKSVGGSGENSQRYFGVLFLRRFVCCSSPVFLRILPWQRMGDSAKSLQQNTDYRHYAHFSKGQPVMAPWD